MDKNIRKVSVGDFRATKPMYEAVNQILDSGRISYGKYSKLLERKFADIHEYKYGILSNSGTSALQVALQALKEIGCWEYGDEVIVPATTFIATANIVLHNELKPVFCDVDERTWNIDAREIGPLLTDKTRCVIPVDLLGLPARTDEVWQTVRHRGVRLISDSCESAFVGGNISDISCYSFYVAHLIVAGVGGISLTNDACLASKMRSLVNHGLEISNLNPDNNFSPRPMTGRRFTFESYGHSYRMTEFEAALAYVQLEDWQNMIDKRNANAKILRDGICALNNKYDNPFAVQEYPMSGLHACMMYGLALNKDSLGRMPDKQPVTKYLNSNGIETRDIPSLLGHKIYTWAKPQDYPISCWLMNSGFYVGIHQYLDNNDIDYVINILEKWCGEKY